MTIFGRELLSGSDMRNYLFKSLLFLIFGVGLANGGWAADKPYDENADAQQLVAAAFSKARAEHKQVMVVFGANWCADCRMLDSVLHAPEAESLGQRFVTVKIDVGAFDKNLSLAKRFEVNLGKGIPAVALADADESVRFATRAGELAEAKSMGVPAVVKFLNDAADHAQSKP